jgi:hypothetical protein
MSVSAKRQCDRALSRPASPRARRARTPTAAPGAAGLGQGKGEKGVKLAQKVQVRACIPVGIHNTAIKGRSWSNFWANLAAVSLKALVWHSLLGRGRCARWRFGGSGGTQGATSTQGAPPRTSRCPASADLAHVSMFQSQPCSCAHCSTASWPDPAAAEQV